MKRTCVLLLMTVIAATAAALQTEKSIAPKAVISPYTYWPGAPTSGRFYHPVGIRIGNQFFMYVQGGAYKGVATGPGSDCAAIGEGILAFKTPWTAAGMRTPFTYVKEVSPCVTSPQDVHYSPGSAFQSAADGRYKLLIDMTENGSDPIHFDWKRTLIGDTADGVNFTWNTFLAQSVVGGTTFSFSSVVLVQATANSNWWGTFRFAFDGHDFGSVGQLRVLMDATKPRGYVVTMLAGDGTWRNVKDDGTIDFVPRQQWEALGANGMGAQSLVFNNISGAWESWGDGTGLTSKAGCPNDDDPAPNISGFRYRTVTQGSTFGPLGEVTSQARAMPSINYAGRMTPFRVNDPANVHLLYSASTDRICEAFQMSGFKAAEILVTELAD